MKLERTVLALMLVLLGSGPPSTARGQPEVGPGSPPPVLLVGRQQFLPGQAALRERLEEEICRAFDRLAIAVTWIDLQSITGPPEALYLDPLASYREMETAGVRLDSLYAARADLAQLQEHVHETIATERTIIAQRRDDLGYRRESIDFSRARYVRVNTFRLKPGHDGAFEEVARIRAQAYQKAKAEIPWVVYQANAGEESATFFVLLTLHSLAEYDDLGPVSQAIQQAQGSQATQRLVQLEREAFAGTESQLYVIRPTLSHVPSEFAAGDPEFWRAPR